MTHIKIAFDKAQHIGKREEQQDALDVYSDSERPVGDSFLFLVADGMGGMQYGKEAAQLAIAEVAHSFSSKDPNTPIQEALEHSMRAANKKVHLMASTNGCAGGAGTTLIVAFVDNSTLYWASVGDSRLYLFRNSALQQLNVEHNLRNRLASLAAKGLFPIDDIETNPQKESLTSFIGIETLKEIDGENRELLLEPGDHILLCTDGLFKTLNSKEIVAILNSSDPKKIASNLVLSAINRNLPHQDNISVIHLQYGDKHESLSRSEIPTLQKEQRNASLDPSEIRVQPKQKPNHRNESVREKDIKAQPQAMNNAKKNLLWVLFAITLGTCLAGYQIFFTTR